MWECGWGVCCQFAGRGCVLGDWGIGSEGDCDDFNVCFSDLRMGCFCSFLVLAANSVQCRRALPVSGLRLLAMTSSAAIVAKKSTLRDAGDAGLGDQRRDRTDNQPGVHVTLRLQACKSKRNCKLYNISEPETQSKQKYHNNGFVKVISATRRDVTSA